MVEPVFDLGPALPEVLLFVAGLGLLVLGAFRDEDGATLVMPIAVAALLAASVLAFGLTGEPRFAFGNLFLAQLGHLVAGLVQRLGQRAQRAVAQDIVDRQFAQTLAAIEQEFR